jgi:acyl-CoA thioester hydrolase
LALMNSTSTLNLRLDWSEMDVFGHINNVMFFKFIQASRVNYWENLGIMEQMKKQHIGPMLASSSMQFLKPLFYPGNIRVEAKVEFIKNSSFGLHHHIYNEKNELCAEAHDVIVMYDFEKSEKVIIDDSLRNKMQ